MALWPRSAKWGSVRFRRSAGRLVKSEGPGVRGDPGVMRERRFAGSWTRHDQPLTAVLVITDQARR